MACTRHVTKPGAHCSIMTFTPGKDCMLSYVESKERLFSFITNMSDADKIDRMLAGMPLTLQTEFRKIPGSDQSWSAYWNFRTALTSDAGQEAVARAAALLAESPPAPYRHTNDRRSGSQSGAGFRKRGSSPEPRPHHKRGKEGSTSRVCWKCGSPNHIQKDCPNKAKK